MRVPSIITLCGMEPGAAMNSETLRGAAGFSRSQPSSGRFGTSSVVNR
jgi:hypothetical protein